MNMQNTLNGLFKFQKKMLFNLKNSRYLLKKICILNEDKKYRLCFEKKRAGEIYRLHMEKNYLSCVFCSNLIKSTCHNYCFVCTLYNDLQCGHALPGTYNINSLNDTVSAGEPWIIREHCSNFIRIPEEEYFKNINCFIEKTTVTGYEFLEGLYLGTSNGHIPCQVCASLEISFFKKCLVYDYENSGGHCNRLVDRYLS